MKLVNLNLKPGVKQLRSFGFLALVAFGLLGAWILWKGSIFGIQLNEAARGAAFTAWALALLSGFFSLIYPKANRPLYVALSLIAYPIGMVISHIIMALIFYGIITPVGLLFKLIGRDPLNRKFDPQAETYWEPHVPREDKKYYFRQF
jgi:hypothetical protein